MSNVRRHGDKWRGLSHAGGIHTWFTNSHKTRYRSAKTTLKPLLPAEMIFARCASTQHRQESHSLLKQFDFHNVSYFEPVLKLWQECLMRHHARPWWRTACSCLWVVQTRSRAQRTWPSVVNCQREIWGSVDGSVFDPPNFARQGLNAHSTEESVRQSLGKFGAISSIKARSHRSHHTTQQPLLIIIIYSSFMCSFMFILHCILNLESHQLAMSPVRL